jgi:hypothetical protein
VRSRLCRAREHLKRLMDIDVVEMLEEGSEEDDPPRPRAGRLPGAVHKRTGTRG